ncbi:hypothetical protein CPLU01_06793 [Colletotrichum plurivorum]|uniref:Uncharacterized protein n=1 Tax=Colletotrichum plurivorum TaxID=2175906 RepID=A0A8H6KH33_9PEZI|nr:hypothetical protein CPLU01_06793 [Colletotrichum plurivorum]
MWNGETDANVRAVQWIGVDIKYIVITTMTSTNKPGETVVATITSGVIASKNAAGNLDILLRPAILEKLQGIAKKVTPCAAKHRRQPANHRRQGGPACGLSDYVQRVAADPSLGKRECHKRHKHDDVHRGYLENFVQYCCKGDFSMRAADESIYWGPNHYLLNIRISWIDGCKVTNLQNIKFPIEDDRSITCEKIVMENYLSCNNGGAGGWVDAGCLRYDFFVDPK